MIKLNTLSSDISACGQISPDHLEFIKNAGYQSIINNRPDMENPEQPYADDMCKAVEGVGLKYIFIPMSPAQLSHEIIDAMKTAFEKLPKPILIHCASGTRSTMLWCFANVKELGVDGVLSAANKAGYDLEQMRPALVQFSA